MTDEAVKRRRNWGATGKRSWPLIRPGQQQAEDRRPPNRKRSTTSTLPSLTNWPRWTAPQAQAWPTWNPDDDEQPPPGRGTGRGRDPDRRPSMPASASIYRTGPNRKPQALSRGVAAEAIRLHDELTDRHHPGLPAVRRAGTCWVFATANGLERSSAPGWRSRDLRRRLRAETDPTKQVELIRQLQDAIGALPGRSRSHQRHQFGQPDEERAGNSQRRTHPAIVENIRKYLDSPNLSQLSRSRLTQRRRSGKAVSKLLVLRRATRLPATRSPSRRLPSGSCPTTASRVLIPRSSTRSAPLEGLTGVSFADPVQAEAEYRPPRVDLANPVGRLQSQIADAQAAAGPNCIWRWTMSKTWQAGRFDDQLTATIAAFEETRAKRRTRTSPPSPAKRQERRRRDRRLGSAGRLTKPLQNNAAAVAASMGTIMTTADQLIERINVNSAQQANTAAGRFDDASDAEFTVAWPAKSACLPAGEIRHSAGTLYASESGYIPAFRRRPGQYPVVRLLWCAHAVRVTAGDERSGSLDLCNDGIAR